MLFASLDICNDPSWKPNITHKHFSNTTIISIPSTKMMNSNWPSTWKGCHIENRLGAKWLQTMQSKIKWNNKDSRENYSSCCEGVG